MSSRYVLVSLSLSDLSMTASCGFQRASKILPSTPGLRSIRIFPHPAGVVGHRVTLQRDERQVDRLNLRRQDARLLHDRANGERNRLAYAR